MTRRLLILSVLLLVLVGTRPAAAQEVLAEARALYASARYDEALARLDQLRFATTSTPEQTLAVETHRALCLLALGREAEADSAFAGIVAVDPRYLPDTSEVSPSVRAFFRGVRRRVLPGVARARYAEARAAYGRRDYADAADRFEVVAALLADDDMEAGLEDLRVLAEGFAELSREKASASARGPAPPDASSAVGDPASVPAAPAPQPAPDPKPEVYGPDSPGVTPPVVVRQTLPPVPAEARLAGRARALLEIVIDERGRVTSLVVRESIHESYDHRLVEAATAWSYEPARLDGKAVKYRKVIEVTVR